MSLSNPLSTLVSFTGLPIPNPYQLTMRIMGWHNNSFLCKMNCSGHGECNNGTCHCEIQFDGSECHDPNVGYFVGFSTVFFLLAGVALAQLVACIIFEFRRMKVPSLMRACRITTQKLLYFLVFMAAVSRGAYFSSPDNLTVDWSSSLLNAYYPILLSGASLIVCFWAEAFHLEDIRCERPHFLSKSFLGFLTFNLITYSLLLAQFVIVQFADLPYDVKIFYQRIFNGCFAVLIFIVVVFFLIYGVEVFFKVRGGFLQDFLNSECSVTLRRYSDKDVLNCADPAAAESLVKVKGAFATGFSQNIDPCQLHQSRLGLVSQALMLLVVFGFLVTDLLREFWEDKVPLVSRNCYDVVFRVVEIGVVLWFPCVLWNCMRPEQLWILNPKKILKKLEQDQVVNTQGVEIKDVIPGPSTDDDNKDDTTSHRQAECWICYDSERTDAGSMIQPCQCRGDLSTVHHDCLRRWLTESSVNPDNLRCKVCNSQYQVEKSMVGWVGKGFTIQHGLQMSVIFTTMILAVGGAWASIQLFASTGIRIMAVGTAVITLYVCLRFLGLNTLTAYQRGRVSAVKIMGRHRNTLLSAPTSPTRQLATISENISPNVATVSLEITATGVPKCPEAQI